MNMMSYRDEAGAREGGRSVSDPLRNSPEPEQRRNDFLAFVIVLGGPLLGLIYVAGVLVSVWSGGDR
jgi:hypothetical protein